MRVCVCNGWDDRPRQSVSRSEGGGGAITATRVSHHCTPSPFHQGSAGGGRGRGGGEKAGEGGDVAEGAPVLSHRPASARSLGHVEALSGGGGGGSGKDRREANSRGTSAISALLSVPVPLRVPAGWGGGGRAAREGGRARGSGGEVLQQHAQEQRGDGGGLSRSGGRGAGEEQRALGMRAASN